MKSLKQTSFLFLTTVANMCDVDKLECVKVVNNTFSTVHQKALTVIESEPQL